MGSDSRSPPRNRRVAERFFAPAKLNLYLHVTGRRDDGWHLLDSLVAFASVGDEVRVTPATGLSLTIGGPFAGALAGDPRGNLVWRAADMLAERLQRTADVAIALTKNLPVASGIGGGSSDAAACLRALAALWRSDDEDMLMEIAATLGSDVPACLMARPVWLGDTGTVIDEAGQVPAAGVVLVNPGIALPTASVYRGFAGPFSPPARFSIPRDPADFAGMLASRRNDLTGAATALVPEIGAVLDGLTATPNSLLARMSGSGATCFALFATVEEAAVAARRLQADHPAWWVAAAMLSAESGSSASLS
jgi:4-diphosphocytidyl-2-C-methyl-D-erythritol kinase